ncbi:MAG: hypothetical protein J2P18_05135 [Nocardia sp.]|nr:hypothetical protein [Nocardia sp.]
MGLDVNPNTLRQVAGALALLPQDINAAGAVDVGPAVSLLKGSSVGKALSETGKADSTARAVLEARFNEFSGQLAMSADMYKNSDDDAANRLKSVADLNSGDPAKKK